MSRSAVPPSRLITYEKVSLRLPAHTGLCPARIVLRKLTHKSPSSITLTSCTCLTRHLNSVLSIVKKKKIPSQHSYTTSVTLGSRHSNAQGPGPSLRCGRQRLTANSSAAFTGNYRRRSHSSREPEFQEKSSSYVTPSNAGRCPKQRRAMQKVGQLHPSLGVLRTPPEGRAGELGSSLPGP